MKRKEEPYKILLFPEEVRCSDGDIHFISGNQLARLYRILPTDIVKTVDSDMRKLHPESLRRMYPNYLWLRPRQDGQYYDVHMQPQIDWEKSEKAFNKLMKIKK